jgi:hypothetical protein
MKYTEVLIYELLHNLHSSPDITVIKRQGMRWTGHVEDKCL